MAEDLKEQKKKLIQWLEGVDNPAILRDVSMVMEESAVYAKPLSKEELASIDRGIAQADAGELIPHDEVKKLYEKYL